ncbi:MAG: glycosyltransferase [Candidatus Omnitrophota bacterium]|nr:MAG: glycosyltransferase [Candidatus Omnitrophota bacterium]
MKKVIIFHISEFGGHSKAAQNIKEALHAKDTEISALNINGLKYFYPYWEKVVDFVYTSVVKHSPSLWGKIYDRKYVIKNLSPLRKLVNRLTFTKLARLIREFNPSCFVATQAFPCGVVADFKKRFQLKTPLIAVVTDYYPHRFWIHSCVDKYVVACPEAKDILLREGIEKEKVKIAGIPISIKFLASYPKEEVSQQLGFIPHLPSVMLMGGGLGIGPIKRIAEALDAINANFQIIVICGRNKRLYNWFTRNGRRFQKPVFCFSYIDFVHKIMDFSDIIITKGGGITISEALAKGLAIIITNPIPGQEERNVRYLSKRGVIVQADEAEKTQDAVRELFMNKKRMYFLKEGAKEISFIDSSVRIVDLIFEELFVAE